MGDSYRDWNDEDRFGAAPQPSVSKAATVSADDWKPCERTVRACIEALPKRKLPRAMDGYSSASDDAFDTCRAALEALLPRDPAKEILQRFDEACPTAPGDWGYRDHQRYLLSWLLAQGIIDAGKV